MPEPDPTPDLAPTRTLKPSPTQDPPAVVVTDFVDACNRRDLGRLLELLHPGVVLRPLRFLGVSAVYYGHVEVERWVRDMSVHDSPPIVISSAAPIKGGSVLARGTVSAGGDEVPFTGVHWLDHGLIRVVSHYFTGAGTLAIIGSLGD